MAEPALRANVVKGEMFHLEAKFTHRLHRDFSIGALPGYDAAGRICRVHARFAQQSVGTGLIRGGMRICIMHGFVPVELTGRSHLVRNSAGLPRHEAHEGGLVEHEAHGLAYANVVEGRARIAVVEGPKPPSGILHELHFEIRISTHGCELIVADASDVKVTCAQRQ